MAVSEGFFDEVYENEEEQRLVKEERVGEREKTSTLFFVDPSSSGLSSAGLFS